MDKQFWSGAVVVLTVVVAGASALPGLLLRPAVEDTAEIVPPLLARPAAAQPVKPAEPVPPVAAEVELASKPVAQPPQPVPAQTALAPMPPPAAVAEAPGPAPAFPPVQPLDAPARGTTAQNVAQTEIRAATASRQSDEPRGEKVARHTDRQDRAKRKRHVRPAIYPMREFLAWRR
jgi:hypothetical protein